MTGAKALIKMLENEGTTVVFGYPGAANAPIYDELSRSSIRHILPRGEQAAAHEASGFALASGRTGVCMATSGPGATNLVTGIANAYSDSVPIVAITGQVPTGMIGRDVFQEVDITGAVAPFCKHSYLLKSARDLPQVVKNAFHIASTGRKGPVLIDIPIDVLNEEFDFEQPKPVNIRGYKPTVKGNNLQIRRVREALSKAKAPLIIAGGGVGYAGANAVLAKFAEKYKIPVVTTLMGINHTALCGDLLVGMIGTHGVSAANIAVKRCDLLLVVGARLGDRAYTTVHSQNSDAVVVHIDIDPAEIGKNIGTQIPVVGDVKVVLEQILKKDIDCDIASNERWLKSLTELRNQKREYSDKKTFINPRLAMKVLSELTGGDAIVATEVGQNQIWAANNYKLSPKGGFITSGGLGAMGFGLPAAIGAKVALPQKTVVAIEGDGSFQMSMGELATIVQWNIPVKMMLFNNSRLGMVRELQKTTYKSNYFAVELDGSPDFIKLAGAYGIEGARISSNAELKDAIEKMLKGDTPYLLELVVDSEEGTL
ncbi:MAG: Acetolactate synthase large subunit [Firmicutes bacterium ADurb.Bin193]|nr:MAG: Acetolactate synthase large subunit [Firmicutes bacterium ADurb.Bin193]